MFSLLKMPKLVDVVAFADADNRLVTANNLATASHVRQQLFKVYLQLSISYVKF